MAAGSNRKRQRKQKTSKGINGSTRTRLSEVQKALMGKGRVQATQHVDCLRPWMGTFQPSNPVFDAKVVAENRLLYPHLFPEEER